LLATRAAGGNGGGAAGGDGGVGGASGATSHDGATGGNTSQGGGGAGGVGRIRINSRDGESPALANGAFLSPSLDEAATTSTKGSAKVR
jgi:hypothetical protein